MTTDEALPAIHGELPATRWAANAEILLWQSRVRLSFAAIVGVAGVLMRMGGVLDGSWRVAAVSYLGYALLSGALTAIARHRGEARPALVMAIAFTDVMCIFGTSAMLMPPTSYERSLFFCFVVVLATEFYFGRRLATFVTAAATLGYLALVMYGQHIGAPLSSVDQLWTLAGFLMCVSMFIHLYGSFRRRLTAIAHLFARMEDGDFSGTYDVAADRYPDAITAVGRAHNRVRGQLATMVLTDPLSGCLNRRGLARVLGREVARAARARTELSLIALDVDNFKRVNDCFGHLAGDAIVREIGAVLRETARAGDVVARLGGDEFALLLPDTGAAGAFQLATRIREVVARRSFEGVTGRIPITVSIGVVSDEVIDANMAEALYARADEALYAAKASGRNRVNIWTPGTKPPVLAVAG